VAAERLQEDSAIEAAELAIEARDWFRSRPIHFSRVLARTATTGWTGAAACNAALATARSALSTPINLFSAKLISMAVSIYMRNM